MMFPLTHTNTSFNYKTLSNVFQLCVSIYGITTKQSNCRNTNAMCVTSISGALAYAELGTMNTSSGAEWAYFMDAFGAPPAFLFSWVSTLVLKPSQMAIICLSFAQYAVEAFVSECEPPVAVVKMVAMLAIS